MKQRIFAVLLIVALLVTATVFAVQADGATAPKDVYEATQVAAFKSKFTGKTTETVNAVCPWCGGAEVEWKPMSTTSQDLGSGHMYVPTKEGGHEFTNIRRIGSSTSGQEMGNICLYLNDQTITFTTRGFFLDSTDQLNIMGNGTVIGGGTATNTNHATIEATSGSVVNICGGTYKSSSTARYIVVVRGTTATNQVNLYDGTIQRTKDGTQGPCVRIADNGEFNMHGGTVTGGSASTGGNFYVAACATNNAYTSNLNIYAGTVSGGSATTNGGNIYVDGSDVAKPTVAVNISETASVEGGVAGRSGGNIFVTDANASVEISGGTVTRGVSNGDADTYRNRGGGNIAAFSSSEVTISGNGQVTDGDCPNELGGNILVYGATLEMTGGQITGGEAGYLGGNVAVRKSSDTAPGTFNMSGGSISGGTGDTENKENKNADNVLLGDKCTMTMSGSAKINNADSDVDGNAIYCDNGSTLILDGAAEVKNGQKKGNVSMASKEDSSAYASLQVKDTFTGTAWITIGYGTAAHNVGYGKELTNGYSSTGAYTGSLYLEHANVNYAKVFGTAENKLVVAGTALMKNGAIADWAPNNNAAVAAAANFDSIKLYSDEATMTLAGGEYAVDLNGKSVTIDGTGTLNGIDDKTDDYKEDNCGTATVTSVTVKVTNAYEVDGGWYIAIPGKSNTYTFHRLEMAITGVSIRPSAAGIYYWAQWDCDATLAGYVDSYGIATSLTQLTEGFDLEKTLYTNLGKEKFTACAEQTGALMTGMLMVPDNRDIDYADFNSLNDMFGKTPIYAVPYIWLSVNDETIKLDCVDSQVSYSLHNLVQMVDAAVTNNTDAYYTAMDTFATTWAEANLGWTYANYEAQKQAASNT